MRAKSQLQVPVIGDDTPPPNCGAGEGKGTIYLNDTSQEWLGCIGDEYIQLNAVNNFTDRVEELQSRVKLLEQSVNCLGGTVPNPASSCQAILDDVQGNSDLCDFIFKNEENRLLLDL